MKNRDIKILSLISLFIILAGVWSSNNKSETAIKEMAEKKTKTIKKNFSIGMTETNKDTLSERTTTVESKVKEKLNVLRENTALRNKALLSKVEKRELDLYFSDSSNIRKAYITLRSQDFENYEIAMKNRINATNFLIDGLKHATTNRDEVVKSIEMFLISEKENNLPLKEKKLVIGDKIDLYHALVLHAPNQIEKFKANYRGKRLDLIMKYVDLHTRRKQ